MGNAYASPWGTEGGFVDTRSRGSGYGGVWRWRSRTNILMSVGVRPAA
jgi:hypothetical protein